MQGEKRRSRRKWKKWGSMDGREHARAGVFVVTPFPIRWAFCLHRECHKNQVWQAAEERNVEGQEVEKNEKRHEENIDKNVEKS